MDWNLEQKLVTSSRFTSILSWNYSKAQAKPRELKRWRF